MINPIRIISFRGDDSFVDETVGNIVDTVGDAKKVVKKAKEKRDEFIAETVGTGAAATTGVAAVTNGNKVTKALGFSKKLTSGTKKATSLAKDVATNSKKLNQEFGKIAQWASKYKLLKPIVKMFHSAPAKFLSGFFAISAAASGVANMINMNSKIIESGKLPKVDLDADFFGGKKSKNGTAA